MLAYYRNLVKKEDLLNKLSRDADELSSISNDLVCKIKEFSASCKNRDVEFCLESLEEAEKLNQITTAFLSNLKENFYAYVSSLQPTNKEEEPKQESKQEEKKEEPTTENPQQLNNLLEAIRSLKEMKDSLDK